MKKRIALLGSTGSIGTQTLQICKCQSYQVNVLAAGRNVALLEKQAREYSPRYVVVSEKNLYQDLKTRLADLQITILAGQEGLCEAAAADGHDTVLNSVVGMVGLEPTLAAIEAGKAIALANKETLVAGGELVMRAAAENKVDILPVDSEHSAIFQCLQGNQEAVVEKVILTASGGPFRGKTAEELKNVTVADTLKHPNWSMGRKITVDSATLMNKGLEFIEAIWLFGLKPNQIEVVVHPQSIIHSAVQYTDGSVIAQLGVPDMAIPIQYALTWPRREPTPVERLSLADIGKLTFEKPDMATFQCLPHAISAIEKGGLYPCAANSANEFAVERFLAGKIPFYQIGNCVGYVLEAFRGGIGQVYTLADVLQADKAARALAKEYLRNAV